MSLKHNIYRFLVKYHYPSILKITAIEFLSIESWSGVVGLDATDLCRGEKNIFGTLGLKHPAQKVGLAMQSGHVCGRYCVVFHNYRKTLLIVRPLTPPEWRGKGQRT
jgi:hypothetical protein